MCIDRRPDRRHAARWLVHRGVAAIDLREFTLLRQIPLEGRPRAVIAHPGRAAVFVLIPENGTVCEIDAVTLSVKRRARPVQSAISMRLAGDGRSLWVLGRDPRALVRVLKPHTVRRAATAKEAEAILLDVAYEPDLILCDLGLPDRSVLVISADAART